MRFYRFGLCLLLCSHCLCADSYWSQVPGIGTVQLTTLDAEQQSVLSDHLNLTAAETKEWLDSLPDQLDLLSCDTIDGLSQRIPSYLDASYKVVSYAGVLKWTPDDKTKTTVWWLPWSLLPFLPQLSAEVTNTDLHLHQPLLITEQQLEQKGGFILVSGSGRIAPGYFALRFNSIEQPTLLWSVSAAEQGFEQLSGAMAQPLLLPEVLPEKQTGLSLLLPNVGANGRKPLLYNVSLLTGELQSKWMAEQDVSELSGAATLYDQNMDSHSDTVVVSTKAGHLWQAQIENNQFYNMKLIADLSGFQLSDMQFVRLMYAAVPVGGSGSDFHSRRSQWLMLLSALQQQKSLFAVVKPQAEPAPVASALVHRPLAEQNSLTLLTGQEWQQIQQKSGWYSYLSGRLTQRPVVVAGVVYLTTLGLQAAQPCSMEQASPSLITMHLHHASAVYRQQVLPLEKAGGVLAVKANAEGGFALIEQNQQQVLIEQLREISPDCTNCSKVMQQDSFPRWQLLGTYHSEEGAYE